MEARLLKHRGIYFLYLDDETIVPMRLDDVKKFLQHYADYKYYENLVEKYSVPALKRRFSKEPEEIAILNDNDELLIKDPSLLSDILAPNNKPEFISIDQYAAKHGKKRTIIWRLCKEGRIPGAKRVSEINGTTKTGEASEDNKNSGWLIPADAPYPKDKRKNNNLEILKPSWESNLNNSSKTQNKASRERVLVNTEE